MPAPPPAAEELLTWQAVVKRGFPLLAHGQPCTDDGETCPGSPLPAECDTGSSVSSRQPIHLAQSHSTPGAEPQPAKSQSQHLMTLLPDVGEMPEVLPRLEGRQE